MQLVGEVPYDGGLADVERQGGAPIDAAPNSPAVRAIERLAGPLVGDAVDPSLPRIDVRVP